MQQASLLNITEQPPEWLFYPESRQLFKAINREDGKARFVGGCVRDAFFGKVSDDLDICTDLPPDAVTSALEAAGFKVFPTGIAHGTVTAMLNDRRFEVTTLRLDVETHGRHATVSFTKDFREDAARRDFTFNALSMDLTGRLFDYFEGLEDLRAGQVRFIGEAAERIAEDYLRVLRFFRFYARFGVGEADPIALAACEAARHELKNLSIERVTMEMKSLFSVQNPYDSILLMENSGVRKALLPGKVFPGRLRRAIEVSHDPLIRLAGFFGGSTEWAKELPDHLRLSLKSQKHLQDICADPLTADLSERRFKRQAYLRGVDVIRDQCLLLMTVDGMRDVATRYLGYLEDWQPPEFILQGRDLLERGFPAGPEVGQTLSALERMWVESDFALTEEELLSEAEGFKP